MCTHDLMLDAAYNPSAQATINRITDARLALYCPSTFPNWQTVAVMRYLILAQHDFHVII
jgi:hypothetical protein